MTKTRIGSTRPCASEVGSRAAEDPRSANCTAKPMRVDTTVVETNIHYPTDSSLLGDGVRVAAQRPGVWGRQGIPSCLAIRNPRRGKLAVPSSLGIHSPEERSKRGFPSSPDSHSRVGRSPDIRTQEVRTPGSRRLGPPKAPGSAVALPAVSRSSARVIHSRWSRRPALTFTAPVPPANFYHAVHRGIHSANPPPPSAAVARTSVSGPKLS
jgi:hypothetical protein